MTRLTSSFSEPPVMRKRDSDMAAAARELRGALSRAAMVGCAGGPRRGHCRRRAAALAQICAYATAWRGTSLLRHGGCQTQQDLVAMWPAKLWARAVGSAGPRRTSGHQLARPLTGRRAARAIRLIKFGAWAPRWSPNRGDYRPSVDRDGSSESGDAPPLSSVRLLLAGALPAHRS
jgi:hypothetical protein